MIEHAYLISNIYIYKFYSSNCLFNFNDCHKLEPFLLTNTRNEKRERYI